MVDEEERRPDPDALLRRVHAEEARRRRAKLKIFFGFAAGVGKTYAMLESAGRLREEGVDVVVGYIETHGRKETAALLEGLDVLPRLAVSYRGATLEDLDLDRALARRPAVILVDELAHTNAPGLRHAKRWQDVLDLLDAGVEVHTTLNVQHLESLNDVIEQVTSVRVRETVPDALLDRADEIELVDVSPEELLERLREGKVYMPEQAARSMQSFFRRGNLLALREIALRRTAERVDADMRAYREEHDIRRVWPASERILVCVGPAPASARLVRAGARMAAGLRAEWVAACVELTAAAPLSPADRERLDAHLHLAESMGGEVVRLGGARVSAALLEYARAHHVTRILLGKPTHPRIRDLWRGSLLDEVVRGSGDIDVHVISGDAGEAKPSAPRPRPEGEVDAAGYLWASGLVVLTTGVAWLGRVLVAPSDLVMLYLLAIMLVAARLGRGPSLLAAGLSVAAYDLFFVPPYFTFAVRDAGHLLTFAMMFGVGALISGLTLRIRRQEQDARAREARTASLYALSRELGGAQTEAQAAAVLARHAAEALDGAAAVVLVPGACAIEPCARVGEIPFDAAEEGVARWVLEHGRPAGLGTDTLPGARIACVPIAAGPRTAGALALRPGGARRLDRDARDLLDAYVRQAALAMERARLAEEAKAAALRARAEELRSSLLSAVSHDLRTPLATITGSATALRDDAAAIAPEQRAELLDAICEEAARLTRLVGNLLDMTRIDSGGLHVKREWVPLVELVGSALNRLDAALAGRQVAVDLPPELPLLPVDAVLFEQVLVNLLENASRYTPAGSPIDISAAARDDAVVIEVADRGPGLPPGEEERVFEKFYRGRAVGGGGVGLGLAIVRGIVEAHGGTIRFEHREGGGALFRMAIPLVGQVPSMPPGALPGGAEETEP